MDDERLLLRAYQRLLCDMEVVVAESAKEAITALERDTDFDLVLCDVLMPDDTGVAVYEHVKRTCPELLASFVFVTGSAGTVLLREIEGGSAAVRILPKPLHRADIVGILRQDNRAPGAETA